MLKNITYETPGKFEESRYEKNHSIVFKNTKEASKLVALEIANAINKKKNAPFILGLATGTSPIGVYKELVSLFKQKKVSFKNVITFNLDEYYPIERKDTNSYYSFMFYHLFNHIDIKKENINIPNGEIATNEVREYCINYENKIKKLGGIDIQLLGIGRTAHIGFNEPGSHENSVTRLITLDAITREDATSDFNGINFVPKKAITMGISSIMNAKRIILLAWGHKKSKAVAKSIEGDITSEVPASFLQQHKNTTFLLDTEAIEQLTRYKTPWLVKECEWSDDLLKKKAIVWLSNKVKKPILKLTNRDYNNFGLSGLIASVGSAYNINIWMFNQLQKTITGWPGGKPGTANEKRPERAIPSKKRTIIFSPHPDDDVISMGGTFSRLIEQEHEVHVAYQTSGSIAVSNEEVSRFIKIGKNTLLKEKKENLFFEQIEKLIGQKDKGIEPLTIRNIKASIRRSECYGAAKYLNLNEENLHFLDLPFYETGRITKNPPSQKDIQITIDLIKKIKPHQIFAAGDLADPHGTHSTCLNILFNAINEIKNEEFMQNCWVWLYRGAWQEWNIEEIEMAVPLSPIEVMQKRNAIYYHQSQKDKVMFQGSDSREFWIRAEERNKNTANQYNSLGLAEYEAIEAFKRHYF